LKGKFNIGLALGPPPSSSTTANMPNSPDLRDVVIDGVVGLDILDRISNVISGFLPVVLVLIATDNNIYSVGHHNI